MRDVLFLPLSDEEELVIAADGAAAVGLKEDDFVHAPYETVAYFTSRVALMEAMCVGAEPIAVVLQNFIGDKHWETLCLGIQQTFSELLISVPIVGSTESNFPTLQSAIGVTVIGKVKRAKKKRRITPKTAKFAVIGEPLVGDDVLKRHDRVVPLPLFKQLLQHPAVLELVPVGSKGIAYELRQLLDDNGIAALSYHCALPLDVSSGPATSLLVSFLPEEEHAIRTLAQNYFFPIELQ